MNTTQVPVRSGRSAAVMGGILWFAGLAGLSFGGAAIKSYFTEFGAVLSQLTVSTLRVAETLNSHALLTVAVLGGIVALTLIAAAIARRARAFGAVFLTSGLLAWAFLAVSIGWPAFTLQRAAG
ncbi:MAG: hypothetical protein JSR77_11530 [Planctomycetes bacterium]|nr:hypothetical protein [Planctomycetota bacterium]